MNAAETGLPPGYRITRFYTIARRFPTLIGQLPNGSSVPFGPYTIGQFITLACLGVGGYITMPAWGGGRGLIVNMTLLGTIAVATITAMRKIPWRGRGPIPLLRGAVGGYLAGFTRPEGSYRGRALQAKAPVTMGSLILVADQKRMAAAHQLQQAREHATAVGVRDRQHDELGEFEAMSDNRGAHPLMPRLRAGVGRSLRWVATGGAVVRSHRRTRPSPVMPGPGGSRSLPAHPAAVRPGRARRVSGLSTAAASSGPAVVTKVAPARASISSVQRLREQAANAASCASATSSPTSTAASNRKH